MQKIIKGSQKGVRQVLSKGFTLIELLVVIAIIAILSTVVIGGLQSARAKGADAGIKANLGNVRSQAELSFDTNGCYTNTNCTVAAFALAQCPAAASATIFGETTINQAITAAGQASTGGGLTATRCTSTLNGTGWSVSVPLKTNTAEYWCVDSRGTSKQRTGAQVTLQDCNNVAL